MKTGIYKITSPTGRVYVGQSKDIDRRWLDYRNGKCQSQTRLAASFAKHGVESHVFEVIATCQVHELDEMEILHGTLLDVLDREKGLNLKIGSASRHLSDDTRAKMSASARAARKDPIKAANMVNGLKSHYQKPENRKRLKDLAANRTEEAKYCRAKEVRQFGMDGELLAVFHSLRECAVSLGIRQGNISACCNGKYLSAGGFVFRFGDEPFDKHRTETNKRTAPTIVQMLDKSSSEIIENFGSIGLAERNTGVSKANIHRAIFGKLKSAGGYKWRLSKVQNIG